MSDSRSTSETAAYAGELGLAVKGGAMFEHASIMKAQVSDSLGEA